ncbi:hypothetical protein PTTG_02738, partial [Puccinia triticina 1-1 BBBD Race 1]
MCVAGPVGAIDNWGWSDTPWAAVLAATSIPELFADLLLIDPVIGPAHDHDMAITTSLVTLAVARHIFPKHYPLLSPSMIYDAKRLIGRKFNNADVQRDMKLYPFKVFKKGNKPVLHVEFKGKTFWRCPNI